MPHKLWSYVRVNNKTLTLFEMSNMKVVQISMQHFNVFMYRSERSIGSRNIVKEVPVDYMKKN